jgi:hypothetical protein
MATIEESYKLAANTRFVVLARKLADAERGSDEYRSTLLHLAAARRIEYQKRSKQEMLGALGRMIGDAVLQGREVDELLADVEAVRHSERTGEPLEVLRNSLGEFAAPAADVDRDALLNMQRSRGRSDKP